MKLTIPGARYVREVLTPVQERDLVAQIDAAPWDTTLKRRVQHYGYRYDYQLKTLGPESYLGPLPAWLHALRGQVGALSGQLMDQAIVNEYEPGQGIFPHIDCEPCFDEKIVSVTLLSGCTMTFTRRDKTDREEIFLEPRSALLLEGDARHIWLHGIPQVKADLVEGVTLPRGRRLSITFRKALV